MTFLDSKFSNTIELSSVPEVFKIYLLMWVKMVVFLALKKSTKVCGSTAKEHLLIFFYNCGHYEPRSRRPLVI